MNRYFHGLGLSRALPIVGRRVVFVTITYHHATAIGAKARACGRKEHPKGGTPEADKTLASSDEALHAAKTT